MPKPVLTPHHAADVSAATTMAVTTTRTHAGIAARRTRITGFLSQGAARSVSAAIPGTLCAVYDSPGKRLRSLGEPAWRGAGPWSIPFHDRRKGGADPVFGGVRTPIASGRRSWMMAL
ncbi:hypothetical protein GCM10023068_42880 [Leifsonia shinshuensis]